MFMDQIAKVGTLIKISLLGQKQTTRFLEVNNKRIEKQQPRLYKSFIFSIHRRIIF